MACCAEMSDGWVVIDHLSGAAKVPAIHTDGDRRDLRLDACRGLALWFIFIDRIPDNALAWLTLRNYGFSDATEVFVFVSGYICMLAYGGALRKQGWPTTVTRALRRGWEIYTAFLLLLIAYFTLIWVVGDGSRYLDETNTGLFFKDPGAAIVHAAVRHESRSGNRRRPLGRVDITPNPWLALWLRSRLRRR
jgi:hypothetical protein